MKKPYNHTTSSKLYPIRYYLLNLKELQKIGGLQAENGVYNQCRNMKKLWDVVLSAIVPDKKYVFVKIQAREIYDYSEHRL